MLELKYRITLMEKMLGTVPKNKDIFSRYIASERTGEDEIANVPEGEESGYTGFFTKKNGIYLYDYHIKGFLKEAGNILKDSLTLKNLKSKLDNYLFVFPREIFLQDAPDGVLERPLRAMTMQGPRVSLAKSDYVEAGLSFEITIKVLDHKEITQEVVEKLLDYGALKGLGQWRNGSWGRFAWERV
jgi:hypothetical protein